MKCTSCDSSAPLKFRRRDMDFPECGLPNVRLIGIKVAVCAQCGEEFTEVPAPAALHEALALQLAFKAGSLEGHEVMFLRKVLGYSRKDFASLIHFSYEHLNRIEKNNVGARVTEQLDLLTRFCVLAKMKAPAYELLDAVKRQPIKHIAARPAKDGGWRLSVDAAA